MFEIVCMGRGGAAINVINIDFFLFKWYNWEIVFIKTTEKRVQNGKDEGRNRK